MHGRPRSFVFACRLDLPAELRGSVTTRQQVSASVTARQQVAAAGGTPKRSPPPLRASKAAPPALPSAAELRKTTAAKPDPEPTPESTPESAKPERVLGGMALVLELETPAKVAICITIDEFCIQTDV